MLHASSASASSAKVTKPKPRDLPVSLSMMTLASSTGPKWEKAAERSESSASQGKPPAKTFLLILTLFLGTQTAPSLLRHLASQYSTGDFIASPPFFRLSRNIAVEDAERLEELLPPMIGTTVNDRTCWIFRAFWVDRRPVREIASEQGWSIPAVEFHLKRAERVLKEVPK